MSKSNNQSWQLIWHTMRPLHWVKNILIFMPIVLAHQFDQTIIWFKLAQAFIIFSMIASAIYLLNDLFDIKSDQTHPQKKDRPIAKGQLTKPIIYTAIVILGGVGVVSAFLLDEKFAFVILIYVILNWAYTFKIKKIILLDVIFLSLFYLLRLLAGALIANVALSFWFIIFSIFFFLSLGILKRYNELKIMQAKNFLSIDGRSYSVSSINKIFLLGISSSFLALSTLFFYIFIGEVNLHYRKPFLWWGIFVVFFLWIFLVWREAYLKRVSDDIIVYLLKKRLTWLFASFVLLFFFFSL